MKKPFQIMCENGNLRVLPYDENNALPSVLAEDEEDALKIVDQLYRLQNRAFNAEEIRNNDEDIADKHLEKALDYLENKYDCGISFWDNIDDAVESTRD